jgi:hypothetical protein
MRPRHSLGQLGRLEKGAIVYALILLVVIALLAVSGAGAGKNDTDASKSLGGTGVAVLAVPTGGSALDAGGASATPLTVAPTPVTLPAGPLTAPATRIPIAVAPTVTPVPTRKVAASPIPVVSAPPAPSATLVQLADAFALGTMHRVALGPDGALTLAPAVSDDFTGPSLDTTTWQFVQWSPGGTVSQRDGTVTVNLAAIRTARTFVQRTLEARVLFTAGPPPFENIAWSADLNGPTAIMIGEPVDDPGHLYARIKQEGQAERRVLLPDAFDAYHVYRIAWGASVVEFFVDDVRAATIPAALDTPMRAWISAATAGHAPTVDWARVLAYDASQGAFISTELDAGGDATWGAVQVDATAAAGTALAVRTRTSSDGRTWSAYAPLGVSGEVQSPPGRYLQYEIALSGTESASPTIRSVSAAYTRIRQPGNRTDRGCG